MESRANGETTFCSYLNPLFYSVLECMLMIPRLVFSLVCLTVPMNPTRSRMNPCLPVSSLWTRLVLSRHSLAHMQPLVSPPHEHAVSLQDSTTQEDGYAEPMDTTSQQGSAMAQNESSKLPPVLANLMGNLSNSSLSRSPQATPTVTNPVAATVNVQELLSSIMVHVYESDWCNGF